MTAPTDPPPAPLGPYAHDVLVPDRAQLSPAMEVSKRPTPFQRIGHLWQYRELIGNLTRKELKVKYKNSVLGFVWSLLNPLMYLVVFSLVFNIISATPVPYYGIFFLSGLLAWNLFSAALGQGTSAITGNAQLVTKVWFPREALVLASVFSALVHFFLQSIVLLVALLAFQRSPDFAFFPIFLFALVVLMLFATALAIGLSAINVYLRDTQHLLEVALLGWFWLSAVAYPFGLVQTRLDERFGEGSAWIAGLNPVLIIVITFQRTLYNPDYSGSSQSAINEANSLPFHPWTWYLTLLGAAMLASLVLLFCSLALFSRLEDNFAEEI